MFRDPTDLPDVPQHAFLARQPILDRGCRLIGYELLFRPSIDHSTAGSCAEQATARVITDAVSAFGLDSLTRGKLAFINVNRTLLLDDLTGLAGLLPPSGVVIELLEDIEADDDVLAACRELRRAGYALALDDFTLNERTADLVPMARYIKLDRPSTADPDMPAKIASLCRGPRPSLLAEKVETVEQFDAGLTAGFDYFQGYFFGRPTMQYARSLPGPQIGSLRLLKAVEDPNLQLLDLQALIERDPALCYRILRSVNTARFAQTRQITSIRQALLLMGLLTARRLISLWILAGLGLSANPELLAMSATRARCCEQLAALMGGWPTDAESAAAEGFLLGMCSLLDAILEQPMAVLVRDLPLSADVQAALLGEDNAWRRLLDVVTAFERGDWDVATQRASAAGLDAGDVARAHQAALRWSAEFDLD